MSRLNNALQNDLKLLELLRDETKLQAHLLKADMKKGWDELERKWDDFKVHIERAQAAGGVAKNEAEAAATLLSESLKSGYAKVRDALKS